MQAGYLGVGNMGQPMAAKLLDGGHNLVVFDISESAMEPLLLRQARRAASPKEIGDQCEIAVVSLPTLAAFREAVLGPQGLAAGGAVKLLLNTCTVGVPFCARSRPRWRRAASQLSIARFPADLPGRGPAPCRSWCRAIQPPSSASGR